MNRKMLGAMALLCAGSFAMAQSVSERDGLLADAEGRTLYTFDKDGPDKSACYQACAANWPPFLAAEAAVAKKDYGIVMREDGGRQWAWKSKPLYYFAADTKPGDVLGDGKGGAWHVVRMGKGKAEKASGRAESSGY